MSHYLKLVNLAIWNRLLIVFLAVAVLVVGLYNPKIVVERLGL